MKVSSNFSLKELTASDTAERLDIDNSPNDEQIMSLAVLANRVLQPVRDQFGVVTITSGLRSQALNEAVKGSKTSSHCRGEAADFECFKVSNIELAKWVREHLDYDQLILEFYRKGDPHSGWVHCSFKRDGSNRKQDLTALKGKGGIEYLEGITDG